MSITFLRTRPAVSTSEVAVATRRREGTTTLEVEALSSEQRLTVLSGGILPVARGLDGEEPAAWAVGPASALTLAGRGIPGWRLTIVPTDDRAEVLEALARTRAVFLRCGRRAVAAWQDLAELPGIETTISTFVDTVTEALAAVEAGAGDLLLRDWGAEQIGELRDTLRPLGLIERPALPVGLGVDRARHFLDPDLLRTYLDQVDATGAARPRTDWAPGKAVAVPAPPRRLSAQWSDTAWVAGSAAEGLAGAGSSIRPILERSLDGQRPGRDELAVLLGARGSEVEAVAWTADQLRRRAVGDTVTYVVNRNINYTNLCYFRCGFCAFSKGPRSLNLRGEPYLMDIPEIVDRARQAWERGATEVTLQGGIHPDFTGDFYLDVLRSIKAEVPGLHLHAFTPLEVWQGAETLGMPVGRFLEQLAAAGLGSLPGTAAEVLDDRVREHLCPDKIRTAQWAEVMIAAHEIGLRSTATLMFGHIDDAAAWANHLEVIREIQARTGGFTEFVPLPFVHMGSPIYLRGQSRAGPTWDEIVLIHAVARLAFDGLIPNVQASWVKLGLAGGLRLLEAGCNDLGGTLMNEIITRAAGASHGQELTGGEFEEGIRSTGRLPAQRNTLYELLQST